MTVFHDLNKFLARALQKTQILDPNGHGPRQKADHDLFSIKGGIGGNAQIKRGPPQFDADATILRHPPLSNIQSRKNLDP